MEIIEYEPINLYDGRFCKVFHSDWIQLEKPKDVNLAPHFHWHNSFEFNCSISGTLLCEIGSTMAYVKDNDFLFVNPNVIHKSLENSASFLGFAVLVPVATGSCFILAFPVCSGQVQRLCLRAGGFPAQPVFRHRYS